MKWHVFVFMTVLAGLLALSPIRADVIFVDAAATGPGQDGQGWCSAYADLQDGLAAALAGDEIRVANGVYTPDHGTGDRTATFRLESQIVLAGGYAGCGAADPDARNVAAYETVLSGDLNSDDGPNFANYADNSYHVVTYDDPDATGAVLDGFTVTSGYADGTSAPLNQGPGIHIRQGLIKCIPDGPTIRNCVIEKNWALHHGALNDHALATVIENCTFRDNYAGHQGGGLLINNGTGTIVRDCTFERNVTDNEGGGAWTGRDTDATCDGPPSPTFVGCSFASNRARNGGGVWLDTGPASEAVFTDCEFRGNTAGQMGGGVFSRPGSPIRVTRGRFEDNLADTYGGGLWYGGTAVVTDSTFLRNEAGALGAGLYGFWARLTLTRSSLIQNMIIANTGASGGGGLFMYGGSGTIANCWFVGNGDYAYASVGGGGILLNAGVVAISNSAFLGNFAFQGGGALFSDGAEAHVANCTFAQNTAMLHGDGVRQWLSSLTLVNSILWDDQADGSGTELFISDPLSVRVEHNCIKGGWSGTGNLAADPRFLDADGPDDVPGTADDDVRLQANSPCADAGDNASVPPDANDLDGNGDTTETIPVDLLENPRIFAGTVDMGALESADCNRNGFPDSEDIAAGRSEDCTGNGVPDECDIAPSSASDGCRALIVNPVADPSLVALRLSATQVPCFERYITPDAGLTDTPVYLPGDEWGTIIVIHEEIVPAVQYAVEAHYGDGTVSAQTWATTAVWGDVIGATSAEPPDGFVNFRDIAAVVDGFKALPTAVPLYRCDIHPATPDGFASFADIDASVRAYKGLPYPHPTLGPCP